MSDNTPETSQTVTPHLFYEDVAGALTWLARTFGLVEREVETMKNEDGKIFHTAMLIGDGSIMMGCPSVD